MFGSNLLKGLAAAAVLALMAGAGSAAPVNCPGTVTTSDREFTVDTLVSSTCFETGVGNINGNPSKDPLYPLLLAQFGPGHVLIDKSDDSTSGLKPNALTATFGSLTSGLSGAWSFVMPSAGSGFSWTNVILAFKSGKGKFDPNWAAFKIPDGITSGTWAISEQNALSHANLYAQKIPSPVPVPAAGLLLLGALGGLAALRRRRKV